MQVQVPARAEEAYQTYDPTTKLIILRRSPKISLWDSCGLNLHTKTERNNKKYKGRVSVKKKRMN
jgi:hypothetical protein